ncbi:MAG: DUF4331 domain-containing protein [Verrucomicrobiota bacterium]|nr:DUF4331 domain-containing protein [Verrucomicrobiota bacterium]
MKKFISLRAGLFAGLPILLCALSLGASRARAADHGDSPSSANNASADLADLYFFLDPNDNTKAVIAGTMRGFIVPGEAVNMAIFDPDIVYQFGLEETGDAAPDAFITVTFSPRASTTTPQVATVKMMRGNTQVFQFTAPATVPNLAATAPAQVVTTDSASGVRFFAGETDDPFFFDIPAFGRFIASVRAGSPDPSQFNRGRDTFAGYNVMAIALSIPLPLLNSANNVIGVEAITSRADRHPTALFGNVSTRGFVGGNNPLIGGIIVSGNALKRVVIRALGPSLNGVPGTLDDPTVTLYDGQGRAIATNDDWQSSQATDITGTGLAPTNPKEAAIVTTLPPGLYTAVVSGAGGKTGVALVEMYDLDTTSITTGGPLRQIDREGVPAVNVVTIPAPRKDEYNSATPQDDAAGRFAGDIIATLKSLGTSDSNIGILAEVAVLHGDYIRLNKTIANTGPGGGTNAQAAFPNGRRLGDDVIDTLLSIVTNGAVTSDNVNANDVPFTNAFPFLGLSQQPRAAGVVDDNTRN